MVRLNRTRVDYLEKFQQMIDEYNVGQPQRRGVLQRLRGFAQSLNAEERRGWPRELTEEELAVFDLLTKPEIDAQQGRAKQVKKVARDLLETLKREKLVLDWRKRQQSRAAVRVTIEKVLDAGLPPAYSTEISTARPSPSSSTSTTTTTAPARACTRRWRDQSAFFSWRRSQELWSGSFPHVTEHALGFGRARRQLDYWLRVSQ